MKTSAVEDIGSQEVHLKTLEKVKGHKSQEKTSAVESVATSVGGRTSTPRAHNTSSAGSKPDEL